MLTDKYFSDTRILHTQFKQDDSCIWRAIAKGVETLGPGLSCMIGKGRVSLWYGKWIDDTFLRNVVPFVHISDTNLHLCDIVENGVRNFNILYTQLPLLYQDRIRNVILDIDTNDKLILSSSPNGIYSAGQGYIWLERFSNQHNMSNTYWKWIWRLRVSENLKHFCSLMMHGSLPTNALRGSRHYH